MQGERGRWIYAGAPVGAPSFRSGLTSTFLSHVDMIIRSTKDEVSVSTTFIKMLSSMYSYWTHHDLLPKDSTVDNRPTLLDRADIWLADRA
jgi:hypothetical protein